MNLAVSKSSPDLLYSFRQCSGGITSLKYVNVTEEEAGIVSGSSSGEIHLWSLKSKRSCCHADVKNSVVLVDTCYINQERKILSQSRGGSIHVWDYSLNKIMSCNINDPGFCKLATFDERSRHHASFAVPHSEHKVDIHNFESNQVALSFSDVSLKSRGLCMCVKTLFATATGVNYIFGGFEDGNIIIWDERKTSVELSHCQVFSDPVFSMAVDASMLRGIAGSHHETLQSFRVSLENGVLEKIYSLKLKNPGVGDIAVRNDSKIFATGGWDGRIRVFSWSKGKTLAVINYHTLTVNTVQFASRLCPADDSSLLMCGSQDGIISTWKLY